MTGEEEGRGGRIVENDSSILGNLSERGRRGIRGEECEKKEGVGKKKPESSGE